jgi:hypothetical protein
VDLYEVVPILALPLDILLDPVMPEALHEFHLVRKTGEQETVWASITVVTPVDPTLADIIAALDAISFDGKLSDGAEKTTLRIWWLTAQSSPLVDLADTYAVSHTAYSAAYDVLETKAETWLGTGTVDLTTPEWTAPNPTLEEIWVDYFIAEQDLREAIAAKRQENALVALTTLNLMANDGYIIDAERPGMRQMWSSCELEYPTLVASAATLWATATPTQSLAYRNAYAALAAKEPYWDSAPHGDPAVTITGNTNISSWSPSLTVLWSTYLSERTKLQDAMTGKVQSNYTTLLTDLSKITNDGLLTDNEKIIMKAWWTGVPQEHTDLINMCPSTVSYTAYNNSYTALDAHKSLWTQTIAGVWDVPGTAPTGAVDISAYNPSLYTHWTTYWAAKLALQQAMIGDQNTNITTALEELYDMAADSIISPGEKPILQARWTAAQGQYETLGDKARTSGTSYSYLVTAFETLSGIITAMIPPLSDFTQATEINSSTFYAAWVAWDQAVTKLSTSLTTTTPVISAASPTYIPLSGSTSSVTVDGISFAASSGGKFLLGGQESNTPNGVYTLSSTSSGGGTSAVFALGYTLPSSGVTNPSYFIDQDLNTYGTVTVLSAESSGTTQSRVLILKDFPTGPAASGTLTLKLRARGTFWDGNMNDGFGRVIGAYSTDGGITWVSPPTWEWSAISGDLDTGVITVTISLTGVTMSFLQVRFTVSASSARTSEPA